MAGWLAAAPGWTGRRSAALGLMVLGSFLGSASSLAAQLSAAPAIVELSTGDSAAVGTIEVKNQGDGGLSVRVYTGDFEQTAEGNHTFLAPGEHERSCADRMHIFPEGATLAPGEKVDVAVRLESGETSCWSVVFVETVTGRRDGLAIAQRIAVKLYGTPAETTGEAEVAGIESAEGTLSLAVRNTSERPLVAEGEVEIRSIEGVVLDVISIDDFSILPQRTRTVQVTLPATLEPGRYLAIPIIDFGGDYLAGGQALFDVPD